MTAGPPTAAPWQAPAGWRAIEFISDLHLWEQAPRTFEAWQAWLLATDADALFILGDLFEVWIGDDARALPFPAACVQALAAFGRRRPLYFLPGNRDFLIGAQMLAACHMQPLAEPTRLDAFGQSLLLSHGDAACLEDLEYQQFRRQVRSEAWQQAFLARPLEERAAIARQIRGQSQERQRHQPDPSLWADLDADEVRRWLMASGASTLVHGHTHRPAEHALGDGLQRIVLSDWDCEGPQARGEALRLDARGWHRLPIGGPAGS